MNKARVFISHSSKDKAFVSVLVGELEDQGLDVWFDTNELRLGDSIVAGIAAGLTDSDYVVIVLSPDSVSSPWVQQELNTALWRQLSGKGVVVIPILYRSCDIPPLLQDRIYADFRNSAEEPFRYALQKLLEIFRMEEGSPEVRQTSQTKQPHLPDCHKQLEDHCISHLEQLSLADLRRAMSRLSEAELALAWHSVMEGDMYDCGRRLEKIEYVLKLILEVQRLGAVRQLIRELCKDFPRILCR